MFAIVNKPVTVIAAKVVDGDVNNDQTLEWLAKAAVSHARARRHRRSVNMMDGVWLPSASA